MGSGSYSLYNPSACSHSSSGFFGDLFLYVVLLRLSDLCLPLLSQKGMTQAVTQNEIPNPYPPSIIGSLMYMCPQKNQSEASWDWFMNTGFAKLRQLEPGSHLIYYVEGKFASEAKRAAEVRDGQREGEKP